MSLCMCPGVYGLRGAWSGPGGAGFWRVSRKLKFASTGRNSTLHRRSQICIACFWSWTSPPLPRTQVSKKWIEVASVVVVGDRIVVRRYEGGNLSLTAAQPSTRYAEFFVSYQVVCFFTQFCFADLFPPVIFQRVIFSPATCHGLFFQWLIFTDRFFACHFYRSFCTGLLLTYSSARKRFFKNYNSF